MTVTATVTAPAESPGLTVTLGRRTCLETPARAVTMQYERRGEFQVISIVIDCCQIVGCLCCWPIPIKLNSTEGLCKSGRSDELLNVRSLRGLELLVEPSRAMTFENPNSKLRPFKICYSGLESEQIYNSLSSRASHAGGASVDYEIQSTRRNFQCRPGLVIRHAVGAIAGHATWLSELSTRVRLSVQEDIEISKN